MQIIKKVTETGVVLSEEGTGKKEKSKALVSTPEERSCNEDVSGRIDRQHLP